MLVVGATRVVHLRWDRVSAELGEACELLVTGAGLTAPIELHIDRDDGSGAWTSVDAVRATVTADGKEARARWIVGHTAAEDPANLTGWFEDEEPEVGDTAWISGKAPDPDGASLEFFLEREDGAGWVLVGQAVSTVRGGLARAGMRLEAPVPAKDLGALRVKCTFPLVSIYLVRKDEGPVELGGPTGITTDALAISSKLFLFNDEGSASFERLPPGDYFVVVGADDPRANRSPSQVFPTSDGVQVELKQLLDAGIFFEVPVSAGGTLEVTVKATYQTTLGSCC